MSAERDTPEADEADRSEQDNPATSTTTGSEADVLEQTLPVEEHQIRRPGGNREEASEADWLEQSIEVPVDDDNQHD